LDPSDFLKEIKVFLDKEFPGFTFFIPDPEGKKSFSFFKHYHSAGISLVVYPSIRYVKGEVEFVSKRLKVLVFRTDTREWLFGLKHINRFKWEKGLRKRLIAIRELARDAKPCKICSRIPYAKRYFSTKDGKGTKFVAFYCPVCEKYQPTTYGLRLKSNLHSLLKF
jgi:hypothetical protein